MSFAGLLIMVRVAPENRQIGTIDVQRSRDPEPQWPAHLRMRNRRRGCRITGSSMAILFGSVDTPHRIFLSRHIQMYRYLHLVEIAYRSHPSTLTFGGSAGQLESERGPYLHAAVVPEADQPENQGSIHNRKDGSRIVRKKGARLRCVGSGHVVDAGEAFEEEPGRGIRSGFWQPHLPLGFKGRAIPAPPSSSSHPACLKKLSRGPWWCCSRTAKARQVSQARRPCHLTSPRGATPRAELTNITQPHLTNAHCIGVHLLGPGPP